MNDTDRIAPMARPSLRRMCWPHVSEVDAVAAIEKVALAEYRAQGVRVGDEVECAICHDYTAQGVEVHAVCLAGVRVGDDGLRTAAKAVLEQAETDDDFDGQFTDYLVPFAAIDALRAALAASPARFTGQMTWPCTCGHPKSDHYFGDRLGPDGLMHTWCQRKDGCEDFAASPAPTLDRERLARVLLRAVPGYRRWLQPVNSANEARQREDAMDAELWAHARAIAEAYEKAEP